MPAHSKVIVIGAGPSGSSTAYHLLEQGVEQVLVLDKAGFPRDKLCGGGLTRNAQKELDRMGLFDEVNAAAWHVPKPYLVLPSGHALYARSRQEKYTQLLVLNRRILDEIVMRRARERGAEIREGVEVSELVQENERCVGVRTKSGETIAADFVVVAAGARSARFRPTGARQIEVVGFEARYEGEPTEPGTACLVFDKAFVPQYGWVFPESANVFNVGVAVMGTGQAGALRERLDFMVERYLPCDVRGASLTCRATGFPIHVSKRIGRLVDGNVVYVGEAGSLADPLSLEGISQALVSGRLAAGSIAEFLATGDRGHLRTYEKATRRKFAHFPFMPWVGAILSRRPGARLIEAALRRSDRWHVDEQKYVAGS